MGDKFNTDEFKDFLNDKLDYLGITEEEFSSGMVDLFMDNLKEYLKQVNK
ncbi:MAG: hypothetical protein JNJ56_14660 [Ignavibacteria bacterium]|nr:hypothetical protein [Ignavibacteria bacterium]